MSFKPEVIADSSGKWVGNAFRFATKAEAEASVKNLEARWTLVTDTRVVESDEPVNYKWLTHADLAVRVTAGRAFDVGDQVTFVDEDEYEGVGMAERHRRLHGPPPYVVEDVEKGLVTVNGERYSPAWFRRC